jgi:ribonuclease HII
MSFPTLHEENKLYLKGYQRVVGLDEVGRGAWAGPLIAAAVLVDRQKRVRGVHDSKLLTPQKREMLYVELVKTLPAWGIGVVEHDEIDRMGIVRANALAMERAVARLSFTPDMLLVDGLALQGMDVPVMSFIKGDQRIYSISCASILAKVTRDALMTRYHRQYPQYRFDEHKGYGTSYHYEMICNHGLCDIHRRSFNVARAQ